KTTSPGVPAKDGLAMGHSVYVSGPNCLLFELSTRFRLERCAFGDCRSLAAWIFVLHAGKFRGPSRQLLSASGLFALSSGGTDKPSCPCHHHGVSARVFDEPQPRRRRSDAVVARPAGIT